MGIFIDRPDILEVTLRDGSYVIDFQFTAEDTAALVSALEGAGFRWIEIGHGLGLNASETGKRRAAASDEQHLEAAARAVKSARWGTFFIPGIGREEDLRLAAQYNMSFVRIGTNINEAERAHPFIALAKELGMIVCYNAMKSYAVSPQEFAKTAAQTQAWGADIVYIVDSAGTMYPEDVNAFFKAIQAECDVPIGFHGHDNLSLAMANTLQAVDCGAVLVDSSLRGMGRSAGNAITEAVVATLKRRGQLPHIDLKATMDISAGLIEPLIPGQGLDTMAIIAGFAGFHSSLTAKVQTYAEQYNIDVRDLIVRLCEENRLDAPPDLLQRLSIEIANSKSERVVTIPAFGIRPPSERQERLTPDKLYSKLYAQATKARNYSVLNIVMADSPQSDYQVSSNTHDTPTHSIGSVTVSNHEQLNTVLQSADGQVDVVLLDTDRKPFGPQDAVAAAHDLLKQTRLLTYSDSHTWVQAVKNQVISLLHGGLENAQLVIAGDHTRSRLLALQLLTFGAKVTILTNEQVAPDYVEKMRFFTSRGEITCSQHHQLEAAQHLQLANAVIVWSEGDPCFGAEMVSHLPETAFLLDAGIGSILSDGLQAAREHNIRTIRVNIWPTMAGTLLAAHESARINDSALGWDTLDGVPVVAGGAIGDAGVVIIDSIRNPTRVIGVADGNGSLLPHYTPADAERVRQVTEAIYRQRVKPNIARET
jgi:4-hydroxy-2-oxovalerate aldolase